MTGNAHSGAWRDVPLPDNWDEWDDDAKMNFRLNTQRRGQLKREVAARVGFEDDGKAAFRKEHMAAIAAALEDAGVEPEVSGGE